MPKILKHTDYAARVVLYITGLGAGARVPISEIAKQRLMPGPFVRRVVAQLALKKILQTTRGSKGGVSLARSPAKISMFDVIVAMEGGIVLNRCATKPDDCPFSDKCPVRKAWRKVTIGFEKSLKEVTFEALSKPLAKISRKRKER